MKQIIMAAICLAGALQLSAQPPLHAYELNNSYADEYGGNPLTPNGGSLTTGGYLFDLGQGPAIIPAIDACTYSIVLRYIPGHDDYWAKVLDFKNKLFDTGIYITDRRLMFISTEYNYLYVAYNVIYKDVPAIICITRDGATKIVTGYVDGVEIWAFEDTYDEACFTGPGNIIQIGIDDNVTNHLGNHNAEEADGLLDYVRIYDHVIVDADLLYPPCGETDSDCDGVYDGCDNCPGGDDSGPCVGLALPPLNTLPASWLCSNNNNTEKILICHDGATMCVSENAAATHMAHGDFLGPCISCENNFNAVVNPIDPEAHPDIFTLAQIENNTALRIELVNSPNKHDRFSMYDATGREVWNGAIIPGEQHYAVPLNEIFVVPGIYFIRVVANGIPQTKHFWMAR